MASLCLNVMRLVLPARLRRQAAGRDDEVQKTGNPSPDAHCPEALSITTIADGLPADEITPLRQLGSRNTYSETYARSADAERVVPDAVRSLLGAMKGAGGARRCM